MKKSVFVTLFVLMSFFSFSKGFAQEYWGYHLILDCQACEIDTINNRDQILAFVNTLVKEIDMVAYGEPILERFATHDPKASGYSLVQLIETSSITAHFVDDNGDAYIDIFSCKNFDREKAIEVVKHFFRPQKVRQIFFIRQA